MKEFLERCIEQVCDADFKNNRRASVTLGQCIRYGRFIAEQIALENEEAACCDQTASKYAEQG